MVDERGACALAAAPKSQRCALRPLARPMPKPVKLTGWILLACAVLGSTGCQRPAFEQARQLVERYNQVVAEAYRRGDVKLIDAVVGPNEGRKIVGLIGVRRDAGLSLDSQLLSLEVTGVAQADGVLRVQTQERWQYRDRKLGTGEPVGEESLDAYQMLYVFKLIDKVWLVDEIRFTAEPQVGRKQLPFATERRPTAANRLTTEVTT
jgi:hypothetical protein